MDAQTAQPEEMVPCPTCDGTGYSTYRGDSHYDYDEPDYVDTCAICGGERFVPASMFTDAPDDEDEDDPALAWDFT